MRCRSAAAPDAPTIAETRPGFEAPAWRPLFAPAGTPAAIVRRWNRELIAVLQTREATARYTALGVAARSLTPADVAAETQRRGEVARRARMRAE